MLSLDNLGSRLMVKFCISEPIFFGSHISAVSLANYHKKLFRTFKRLIATNYETSSQHNKLFHIILLHIE